MHVHEHDVYESHVSTGTACASEESGLVRGGGGTDTRRGDG